MITLEQLKAELKCYMVSCPLSDFSLQNIVDAVNEAEQCMIDNGYPTYQIQEALMTAALILALYRVGSYLKSRSVDDASEATDEDRGDRIDYLEAYLFTLDPAGCITPLLPVKPEGTFFMTIDGNSCKKCGD